MCGAGESSSALSVKTTRTGTNQDNGVRALRSRVGQAMTNMGATKHDVKGTLARRGHKNLQETLTDRFDNDILGVDPKKGVMIAGDSQPIPFPDPISEALEDELIGAGY